MHYIRLLRSPMLDTSGRENRDATLSLLLTITTDLGDAFLNAGAPVQITASIYSGTSKSPTELPLRSTGSTHVHTVVGTWQDGLRVLKVKLLYPRRYLKEHVDVAIMPGPFNDDKSRHVMLDVKNTGDVLPWYRAPEEKNVGGIVPVWVEINQGVPSPDTCLRCLPLECDRDGSIATLELQEDIGESIARHVWDAGVVTALFLASGCKSRRQEVDIRDFMPITNQSPNILELGCGVGILGTTIAKLIHFAAEKQGLKLDQPTVLLTDVPEAEERARSNIERNKKTSDWQRMAKMEYENLDWDDGKTGKFGPIAASRFWDYIVLSDCTYNVDSLLSLVGTLSALHDINKRNAGTGNLETGSKVILATKPRHDSEKALFELLPAAGWGHELLKSIPLPVLGSENQVVELYLLQKGRPLLQRALKRKVEDPFSERPASKRAALP
ncbi:putative methyltransferase-domain-containing protein [Pseudomassariella vexata]|uniref:Putative methyltransferase-domain-containing protein n=1 Tax=Pseudomassariella vexata TaxID=1141098 RepID=A0A1Y2DWE2_9PEZI|nr:putative methyltransferase-domain-containing protein [Pseudomassariella vexata]ORY63583.1 putative methyltransferase-domain-containing protein [Pseudomassariella vexata]